MLFTQILEWMELHPVLTTVFVLPMLGALATFIWKPRNPQEWEKLGPFWGGVLKFVASTFPDPRGMLQGLQAVVSRRSIPAIDLERQIASAALGQDVESIEVVLSRPPESLVQVVPAPPSTVPAPMDTHDPT